MPFSMPKIATFSFNRESFWSAGGFMFVKNLLLLINFLSMLAGLILIIGGAYSKSTVSGDNFALLNVAGALAGWAIAIGVIVTAVGFFGCFGAANEKGMLLKTYFAMLLLLVVLEIAVGIAAYAKKDDVENLLGHAWEDAYKNDVNKVKAIERAFSCCGYKPNQFVGLENCEALMGGPPVQSCHEVATASLKGSLNSLGGAAIALGIIELIGLIFSAVLFRKIAQKERASESLMNEAWRINRNKIQYGYQNYQYV
ncbi:hypothetical protein HK097_011424 [Rhizophlyctis rosea]|uniref:Tetraspanin n=1 Tax=Rhizophlyctis rosea TaxID=64517 RepID=A0AAD5S7U8_9FUNG|nr:hypothetical protein HK097_011424 [Rhizophlyctis rosea]